MNEKGGRFTRANIIFFSVFIHITRRKIRFLSSSSLLLLVTSSSGPRHFTRTFRSNSTAQDQLSALRTSQMHVNFKTDSSVCEMKSTCSVWFYSRWILLILFMRKLWNSKKKEKWSRGKYNPMMWNYESRCLWKWKNHSRNSLSQWLCKVNGTIEIFLRKVIVILLTR